MLDSMTVAKYMEHDESHVHAETKKRQCKTDQSAVQQRSKQRSRVDTSAVPAPTQVPAEQSEPTRNDHAKRPRRDEQSASPTDVSNADGEAIKKTEKPLQVQQRREK